MTKRLILGVLAILVLSTAALAAFRKPLAERLISGALVNQGWSGVSLDVTTLNTKIIEIKDLKARSASIGAIDVETLSARYQLASLIRDRQVETVSVGPGDIRLTPDFGAMAPDTGARQTRELPSSLPFDVLEVREVRVGFDSPAGNFIADVNGVLNGDFAGELRADLTASAGDAGRGRGDGVGRFEILAQDTGALSIDGALEGAVFADDGPLVEDASVEITGEILDWRVLLSEGAGALRGDARLVVDAMDINVSDAQSSNRFGLASLIIGNGEQTLRLVGTARARLGDDGVHVDLENELAVQSSNGAVISVTAPEDKSLLIIRDGVQTAAAIASITAPSLDGRIALNARRAGDGAWTVQAPIALDRFETPGVMLGETSIDADVKGQGDRLSASLDILSDVQFASLGRLAIEDAMIAAPMALDVDLGAERLDVRLAEGACMEAPSGRGLIKKYRITIDLTEVTTCVAEDNAPLAEVIWGAERAVRFRGSIDAARMDYRQGQTRLVGAPPRLSARAVYSPEQRRTTASGAFRGGDMTVNNFARGRRLDGQGTLDLGAEELKIGLDVASVVVSEPGATPNIAPVVANGTMTIVNNSANFSYDLKSMRGEALGVGSGAHDIATAKGTTTVTLGPLDFRPGRLQPSRLAPVLRGIIGETTGEGRGSMTFSWRGADLSSRGRFAVDDTSFVGPGLVVSETRGVTGEIALSSLWPVQTEGVQNLSIGAVDFGALVLQDGAVSFEMPGDQTLNVLDGGFPWFGGRLEVGGTTARFSGGNAVAPLTIKNMELSQALAFFDVDGLSGEGALSGVMPLSIQGGRARIDAGVLNSVDAGRISFRGNVSDAAGAAGEDAKVAFDLLRDLRYDSLSIGIDGPLDGEIDFTIAADGVGLVTLNGQDVLAPVKYRINLEAAILELINQANLSRNLQLQIQQGLQNANP